LGGQAGNELLSDDECKAVHPHHDRGDELLEP